MKLVIKKNAVEVEKAHGGYFAKGYLESLSKIAGTTVDVETDHLFQDQYNIVQENLRVFDKVVEEVIDDARTGRARCNYCGLHTEAALGYCPFCNRKESTLTPFKPFVRLPDNPGPSEYELQAEKFLRDNHITFKAEYLDAKCPLWCDGMKYRVTFRRKTIPSGTMKEISNRASLSLFFWNSQNDAANGKEPRAYDVLASITKNDPGSFENFCSEFGYDTDSRKAEKTYKAVVKEWKKVEAFFTEKEIEQLQEIN